MARIELPSTRQRTTCTRRSFDSLFMLTVMLERSGTVKEAHNKIIIRDSYFAYDNFMISCGTMSVWSFFNYVDDRSRNVIRAWVDEDVPPHARKDVRRRLNARLDIIADLNQLGPPQVTALHGECEGLMEIKFEIGNVQYRPLACYGPGSDEVTLLMGATERGGRFVPANACATALSRAARIYEPGRVCPHDI